MSERSYSSPSIRGPVIQFIVILVLIIVLTVLWNVVLVHDYQQLRALAIQGGAFHWTFIALGSGLFIAIIALSSVLSAQLFIHIRWRQRQSNFIASVSHELNSPLSSIKLFAQTLRRDEITSQDRRGFVEKILFDVDRLSRLIANILRAAEIDNRGDEVLVHTQEVEISGYLAEYLDDARTLNAESKLTLSLVGDEEIWVALDRMMFRQVLDNLVDNAIRYRGDQPPAVEIHLARRGAWAEIRITDRGIGLPAAELLKVFDRFYRVEGQGPMRRRKGTGIGLYIVRSIIQAHGGKVGAWSAGPGQGTTIWIRLPLLETPEVA